MLSLTMGSRKVIIGTFKIIWGTHKVAHLLYTLIQNTSKVYEIVVLEALFHPILLGLSIGIHHFVLAIQFLKD